MGWLWWVGVALVLVVVEMVSLELVLLMLAGGALAGAAAQAAGAPLWLQIVIAVVVATVLLVTLRPWLLRHLRHRVPLTETNAAAHVGRTAVVVGEVTEQGGRIKLVGEVWSARLPEDGKPGSASLSAGTEVVVLRIEGATAVVAPLHAEAGGAEGPAGASPSGAPSIA
ncbi:NfeD family protein [Xylanimonas oleitrophica]|uniref:NfeD family protein n=1 Tax=Xylanimonas oleitrophica TaxID=2607479 RepID=UPI0015D08869|nr:NfeD family protein [Xylanimonas oleitrophica]